MTGGQWPREFLRSPDRVHATLTAPEQKFASDQKITLDDRQARGFHRGLPGVSSPCALALSTLASPTL